MKTSLKVFIASLLFGAFATAGGIKVWTSNDTLTAADINGNFAHIHNKMVGGHGARLVDADVSATALISHSKLAAPALVPKAWAQVTATCASSPCSIVASGVSSILRTAEGQYEVNLQVPREDSSYMAIASNSFGVSNGSKCFASVAGRGETSFTVTCNDGAGAAEDNVFAVLLMDNDN